MKRQIQETINNSFVPCFLLVDCVVTIAVVLFWYFLYYDDDAFKIRDFHVHCSDIEYMYPVESATVSKTTLYVVSFLGPTIIIMVFEIILAEYNSKRDVLPKEKTVITFDFQINTTLRRIIRFVGLFLIGAFSTLIFAGVGRLIIGRPAPNFFSVCTTLLDNCPGYVVYNSETCPDMNESTRSSFPSYFAALSTYAALFGGIYLSKNMTNTTARTVRPVLFIGIMLFPFMVCLDRVSTYQEHWSDVIAGVLIGLFIALYMSFCVLNGFEGSLEGGSVKTVNTEKTQQAKGGSGIMQTLTKEATSRASSRHASRREKGDNYMDRSFRVNYHTGTSHRSYYDNNAMDHRTRQEDFVFNHQPPLPSFSEDALNDQAAIAAFKKQAAMSNFRQEAARDNADLGDGGNNPIAADDQPMFLYHH